jgi:YVTN family beta-propeller protein
MLTNLATALGFDAPAVPSAPVIPANPLTDALWAAYRRLESLFGISTATQAPPVQPPVVNVTTGTIPVGSDPTGVALTSDGLLAYVATGNDGDVAVIYVPTGQVLQTIDVGAEPTAIALSPNGTHLYTANSNLNTVSVVDTATGQLTQTIAVGFSPSALAVSQNGARVYVANLDDNTISVIDAATNTVSGTIGVGTSPSAVALSADGRSLYVTNYAAGTISVINTASGKVIHTVSVGGNPVAIALSPDGRRAYVADYTGGAVSVVSTVSNRVLSAAPIYVGGYPDAITVSPDGQRVYVANLSDDTISVIDAVTGTTFARLATGQGPSAIALSPSGATAYVANSGEATVSVLNTTAVSAPSGTGQSNPAGRVSTEGFTVFNVTGNPITFTGYWKSDERPENGGPAVGTVIPPGGSMRFEVIYNFFRTTVLYPEFTSSTGDVYQLQMKIGGVRQTSSSCQASGGAQCKISSDVPGDQKLISLLDRPGTVATIDNAQTQAELLLAFCRQGSLGSCGFKVNGAEQKLLSGPHQVGNTVVNPATNPEKLTKTLTLTDTVTNSDSVTVSAKVSIAFLDKIVNAEITQAYGHTWTNSHTFTESYTVIVPPGYESSVYAQQPILRAYGTFTIVAGNTTLNLVNIYVDTPNTDPNASGRYTVSTTPIPGPPDPTVLAIAASTPADPRTLV